MKLLVFLLVLFLVACSDTTSSYTDSTYEPLYATKDKSSSSWVPSGKSSSSKIVQSSSSNTSTPLPSSSVSENSSSSICEGETGKVWDGSTAKKFACGLGTKLSPYIILTAEQLALLSFVVGANDAAYNGKYFKLGADIVLQKETLLDKNGALVADPTTLFKWTPIGNKDFLFSGNFDGAGFSVSGIFINTTSTHNGLFGQVSGTIENLTVTDSWISGGNNSSGIVGVLYGAGTVKNVTNEASVSCEVDCGGVVGNTRIKASNTTHIENSTNKGLVKGNKMVGGIVGEASFVNIKNVENFSVIEGNYGVAGIAGSLKSSSYLENAYNYANIAGKVYTAGIASYSGDNLCIAGRNYGTIQKAKNSGHIVGTNYVAGVIGETECVKVNQVANTGDIEGENFVAGVIGHSKISTTTGMYNMGKIYGNENVGGIIGYNQEGVTSSAYNMNVVDANTNVGLVIGKNYNTTMADYYYLQIDKIEAFGVNDGGGFATELSQTEMQSAEFAQMLGSSFIFDKSKNQSYPIFDWEK